MKRLMRSSKKRTSAAGCAVLTTMTMDLRHTTYFPIALGRCQAETDDDLFLCCFAWTSASDRSASDASLQGWESRGQCPPLLMARMSSLSPCGAGWETLACMHEGLARSSVSRFPVPTNDDVLRVDDVGENDGQDTGGYSLREGYYLAILVRLGLILLEFGSR